MENTICLPNSKGQFVEKKVPQYIAELLEGAVPAAPNEQNHEGCVYGYVYRIYLPHNNIYHTTIEEKANSFVKWAERHFAYAKVHGWKRFTEKEHRKPYYRKDYLLVTVTDPVLYQLEKCGFFGGDKFQQRIDDMRRGLLK